MIKNILQIINSYVSQFLGKIRLDNKKLLLAAAIALAILYVDLFMILGASLRTIKKSGPKIVQLKQDMKKLKKDLASLKDSIKTQEQAVKFGVQATGKVLQVDNVSQILEEIVKISKNRDIKVSSIKPATTAAPAKGKTDKTPQLAPPAGMAPVLIKLETSGGYHQLGQFINDLENASFFIEVEDLQIKLDPDNYPKEAISLSLRAYVKK